MTDIMYEWRSRGVRKNLFIRTWNWFAWRTLWRALTAQKLYRSERLELSLRSWPGTNTYCYCRNGVVSDFRLAFLMVGIWISYSRDRVQRPCTCEMY